MNTPQPVLQIPTAARLVSEREVLKLQEKIRVVRLTRKPKKGWLVPTRS
jgi:hypothetical protein